VRHLTCHKFTLPSYYLRKSEKKKVLSIYTMIAGDRTHEHDKKNKRIEGKVDRVG